MCFRTLLLATVSVASFCLPVAAQTASLGDAIERALTGHPQVPVESTTVTTIREPVKIRYTTEQIESILDRAWGAWNGYNRLRPRLRKGDSREEGFAQRATSLRYRTRAVERLLRKEKRSPTKQGPQTIAEAMLSLDRSAAPVEYDHDRIALRMALEGLLPPDQPFCLCAAPAFARISPAGPTRCNPVTRAVLSLAQGEGESFQLIVVPFWEPLEGVRIEIGKMYRQGSLDRLGPDEIRLWLVQSVASTPTLGTVKYWPDPLTPLREFDVPATATQSILVDVQARKDQPPGIYEGKITVTTSNTLSMTMPLRVLVRSFSLPNDVPEVCLHVRNGYLHDCFGTSSPSRIAQTWNHFLDDYGLELFRSESGGPAPATGRVRWLPDSGSPLRDILTVDPYGPAAPNALPFRRAGWMAWDRAGRDGQVSCRWLVEGWATLDPCTDVPPATQLSAPIVRTSCMQETFGHPPGLVYLTRDCEPQATLRLISLRDGIEDYRYLEVLARTQQELSRMKKIGWWKRRKWAKLLAIGPKFGDPASDWDGVGMDLLIRREAVGDMIESLQREVRAAATAP